MRKNEVYHYEETLFSTTKKFKLLVKKVWTC